MGSQHARDQHAEGRRDPRPPQGEVGSEQRPRACRQDGRVAFYPVELEAAQLAAVLSLCPIRTDAGFQPRLDDLR